MKFTMIIIGVIVAALGIASVAGKLHMKQDEEVAKVGSFSASVEKDKTAPQWLGISAIVIGGVLVLGGALKKS
jgi:hypothetical protein